MFFTSFRGENHQDFQKKIRVLVRLEESKKQGTEGIKGNLERWSVRSEFIENKSTDDFTLLGEPFGFITEIGVSLTESLFGTDGKNTVLSKFLTISESSCTVLLLLSFSDLVVGQIDK